MARSAATVAAQWAKGMRSSGDKAREGVRSVTVAPGQKAAARADLYAQKTQEAVASGRFQAGCLSVSLSQWQNYYTEKGISRMTAPTQMSIDKVTAFQQFWLPITEQAKQEISGMPKGTPEDSKARMLRNFEILSAQKYKGRR